jgi:hypothetical protein
MNNIDVVRGIATWVVHRGESLKIGILTPQHIYDINNDAVSFSLDEDEKVFGVVINNKFNICFPICTDKFSDDKETAFGYIVSSRAKKGSYSFQIINGFNRLFYNPYEAAYTLGEETNITIRQVKDMVVYWNPFNKL